MRARDIAQKQTAYLACVRPWVLSPAQQETQKKIINWFLEKMNQIDKTLARLIREKRDKGGIRERERK